MRVPVRLWPCVSWTLAGCQSDSRWVSVRHCPVMKSTITDITVLLLFRSENFHLDECDMVITNQRPDCFFVLIPRLLIRSVLFVVIDQDVDELLHSVCAADSAQDVQRFGSVLVQRLQMARQRRRDITAEEMKAVMEERDSSAAKVSPMVHTSTEVRGYPGCDAIVFYQEGHIWTELPSFQTLSSAHAGSTSLGMHYSTELQLENAVRASVQRRCVWSQTHTHT